MIYDIGIISGYFAPYGAHHREYIFAAKKFCHRLALILNNDEQLLAKKGYVFQSLEERTTIMASIRPIDYVFQSVDEDRTVSKTLVRLRHLWPNESLIFLNGGDVGFPDQVAEWDTCVKLSIDTRVGVGGEKTGSSSKTLDNFANYILNQYERIR